jgi:hypothetical protein
MLWNILQAHGGELPDDVVVTFAKRMLADAMLDKVALKDLLGHKSAASGPTLHPTERATQPPEANSVPDKKLGATSIPAVWRNDLFHRNRLHPCPALLQIFAG